MSLALRAPTGQRKKTVTCAENNSMRPSIRVLWPISRRTLFQPENKIQDWGYATQQPQPGCALRTMAMTVHADLHQRLSDRAITVGDKRRLQPSVQIRFTDLRYPFQLLCVGFSIQLFYALQQLRNPRLLFECESKSHAQEQPEPVGHDDVMKKFPQFLVLSGFFVLPNGFQ